MVRCLSLSQAKKLKHGTVLYHRVNKNADGTAQRWRVNGKVKTWKRDSKRIQVPVKHGLYGHDYITENSLCVLSLTEPKKKKVR